MSTRIHASPDLTRRLIKVAFLVAGAALFAGLVWFAEPRAILEQLQRLGWGALVMLIPGGVVYLCQASGWRLSFPRRPGLGLWRLYLAELAGESLNNSLPAAYMGGEPFKVLTLQRWGVDPSLATASAVISRTALILAQALFVLLGLLALSGARADGAKLGPLVIGSLVAVVAILAGIYGLYHVQRRGVTPAAEWVAARVRPLRRFIVRHRDGLRRLDEALASYYEGGPSRLWLAVAMCFLGWSIETLEVALFAHILGLPFGWLEIYALGALATVVKAAGFLTPGSLGTQEGGLVLLFMAFGATKTTGFSFAVLRRFRQLFWIGVGLVVMALLQRSAKRVAARPPRESHSGGITPVPG